MIQVDARSGIPIYEQIYENTRQLILRGILEEDEKISSVRELASRLTINPNTIQKAYRVLENDGYIYSVKGRGNFVKPLSAMIRAAEEEKVRARLETVLKDAAVLGMKVEDIDRMVKQYYEERA